ncbi:MAG: hypothetical protein HZA78_01215 [Candidatus Schekmanbacteria bacterium]|nr:hypothetical protein [Candidatus Schekmanbacteria bacterium]
MSKVKKFIPAICLLIMIIFCGMEIVAYHQSAQAETHNAAKHEKPSAAHNPEHHGAPAGYFIYWLLLIFCVYRVTQFLKGHHIAAKEQNLQRMTQLGGHEAAAHAQPPESADHGGHHPQPTMLDKVLVILVLAMFIMEQNSTLAHYHEPNIWGFIKFLLKAGLGVSLMTYGILGMGEH